LSRLVRFQGIQTTSISRKASTFTSATALAAAGVCVLQAPALFVTFPQAVLALRGAYTLVF